ncbi:ubiquitin carboxyl-terminal hydrolase isozyme L5-like [Rhopilema esculentum]|uniref:ubiquitin carboxyl-terminal hydrolase isozyme L5-like n=1 Tax=Rhopilema esculentum TaxID=499914 RepID=UPI0031DAD85E|eukprot:gene10437-19139_t
MAAGEGSHGDWCLIESDPGVFTELIRGFGCTGVQVEELWSLDDHTLDLLRPVHGLIFLFKWRPGEETEGSIVKDSRLESIFFARQVINNACATQAILSVLLNSNHPDVRLGETLTTFKEFTTQFDASLTGLSITNSDSIKQVHNSFARQAMFEFDNTKKEKDDDVYHFVAFVPIQGRLYELDGLKEGPIDHGACTHEGWLKICKPIIEGRMQKYSAEEIHFNLMAVVSDRKHLYLREIDRLHNKKNELINLPPEAVGLEGRHSPEELSKLLQGMDAEIVRFQSLITNEEDKMLRYKIENVRRKHNYLPFIMELLKILAKKGDLVTMVEKAKSSTKSLHEAKKRRKEEMKQGSK